MEWATEVTFLPVFTGAKATLDRSIPARAHYVLFVFVNKFVCSQVHSFPDVECKCMNYKLQWSIQFPVVHSGSYTGAGPKANEISKRQVA